jgi:hypothetical protein
MRIANYSWLMVVLFFSAASLSAQVIDDSRIPPPPPVTQEEVAAPAPTDAGAIATTDTTAPVAPTEPAMQSAPTAQETSGSIVITREPEEAPASADAANGGEDLPRTASPLALLALLGTGSSGAAFGLRALRRRG